MKYLIVIDDQFYGKYERYYADYKNIKSAIRGVRRTADKMSRYVHQFSSFVKRDDNGEYAKASWGAHPTGELTGLCSYAYIIPATLEETE